MSEDLPTAEFSRLIDRRQIAAEPLSLVASEEEREALAVRFGLVAVKRLEADVALTPDGECVDASGRLRADIVQSCAVTGDDLPASIDEDLALRFVPAEAMAAEPDEEIELEATELDEIPYHGTAFDLGEAVAQSLALAIDPYATGPGAEAARAEHDLGEKGPGGLLQEALAKLKKD